MQVHFFTIPVHSGAEAAEELNRFLAGHRILSVDRQLVQDGTNSAWTLCVTIEESGQGRAQPARRGKVDYREVLNDADFSVYARLRSLRKEIAEADGVPLYALFTNEQMAEMVTRRVASLAALREIPGVGEARVTKYGEPFLKALAEALAAEPPPAGSVDET